MRMSLLITTFVLNCLLNPLTSLQCVCTKPGPTETTHWGGNEEIVFKEKMVYRSLRGVVQSGGRPIRDALVELFDRPDYLLDPKRREEKAKQLRIAACKTGEDGKFCFRNVHRGRYELRASVDSGWNVSHIYVIVRPDSQRASRASIEVPIGVGN
jgi:hypothetical protein